MGGVISGALCWSVMFSPLALQCEGLSLAAIRIFSGGCRRGERRRHCTKLVGHNHEHSASVYAARVSARMLVKNWLAQKGLFQVALDLLDQNVVSFRRGIVVASVALASLLVASAHARCSERTDHRECDLLTLEANGGQPMSVVVPKGKYLQLTNNTGSALQVLDIGATTGEQGTWSEYCAGLDNFDAPPHQPLNRPGTGEVSCSFKNAGEAYPPLKWNTPAGGLLVGARSILYLSSNPATTTHTYTVTAASMAPVKSYRFPRVDPGSIKCNGTLQQSEWFAIQNTSSSSWHVSGANVYASGGGSPARPYVTAACIYILDATATPRWSNCTSAVGARGSVSFPIQLVRPSEYLAAQGANRCPASDGVWNYAAYVSVW